MQTLTLEISDWSRSQVAEMAEIPSDLTVGELTDEVQDAMSLPRENYHILYAGEKLSRSSTLEEIGIESGEELTIAPEVSAGLPG